MPHLSRTEANPLVEAQVFPRCNAHRGLQPMAGDEGVEGQARLQPQVLLILDLSSNGFMIDLCRF